LLPRMARQSNNMWRACNLTSTHQTIKVSIRTQGVEKTKMCGHTKALSSSVSTVPALPAVRWGLLRLARWHRHAPRPVQPLSCPCSLCSHCHPPCLCLEQGPWPVHCWGPLSSHGVLGLVAERLVRAREKVRDGLGLQALERLSRVGPGSMLQMLAWQPGSTPLVLGLQSDMGPGSNLQAFGQH